MQMWPSGGILLVLSRSRGKKRMTGSRGMGQNSGGAALGGSALGWPCYSLQRNAPGDTDYPPEIGLAALGKEPALKSGSRVASGLSYFAHVKLATFP